MPADTIFRETIGSGSSATVLDFIYDNHGLPFALNYSTNNGSSFTTYYYVLNLQGDVVKLVDGGGTSVASYAYDAWGDILSSSGSKAEINPLRYRGYYYDTETGFYYVSSRYYVPEIGRWINADNVIAGVGGDVMFMPDPVLNTGYFGLTGNVGFGTPGKEFHVEWGTTVTLPYTQFNVYEVARSVYIKIMEW